MRAVGKTPNGFKSIRISSHTHKNIQEGSAEIICEDIDILSNPTVPYSTNYMACFPSRCPQSQVPTCDLLGKAGVGDGGAVQPGHGDGGVVRQGELV